MDKTKVIVIGLVKLSIASFSKYEIELLRHRDKIEIEISNLERAGIKNAREAVEQAMLIYSFEDMEKAFMNLSNAIKKMSISFDDLTESQKRLKENQPLEKTPSKYINKPRYNFKRR